MADGVRLPYRSNADVGLNVVYITCHGRKRLKCIRRR